VVDYVLIVGVVVLIVLINVSLIMVYAARYKKVPPNHAMVLFGRQYARDSGMHVWMSGGKFIQPIVESYALLSLAPVAVDLGLDRVRQDAKGASQRDVRVEVRAMVEVPADKEEVTKAARRFLSGRQFMSMHGSDEAEAVRKAEEEMKRTVSAVLEKDTRVVVARAPADTPEVEIADAVTTATTPDLADLGVRLVSLVIVVQPKGGSPPGNGRAGRDLAEEVQQLDVRLRRIEERLGPPAPS